MASLMREYPKQPATCNTHGDYESVNYFAQRWSGCPECAREKEEQAKREAEAAKKRERQESRKRVSGAEGRFAEASFDDFSAATAPQQKVLSACREYVAKLDFDCGAGLWLIGPPGTGKTHLGSAMVRAVIEDRDETAAIHSGREMIRLLRSTWGNKEHGRTWDGRATREDDMLDDFIGLGLLVIDEIGVGFGSESEQVQLFDIIDGRYKHRRPTVLLSNLPTKELKTALGERAYDRLRESAQVLVCGWDSHRGKAAAPKAPLEVVR